MTTYNTGNPIGSTDARDLYDNAQNLDTAINSTAATFKDRLGATRPTLASAIDPTGIAQQAATSAGAAETATAAAEAARDGAVVAQSAAVAAKNDAVAAAAGLSVGVIGKTTLALLTADLAYAAGAVGMVTNDPTTANNGYYIKSGASGSGSWAKSAYDPNVSVAAIKTDFFNQLYVQRYDSGGWFLNAHTGVITAHRYGGGGADTRLFVLTYDGVEYAIKGTEGQSRTLSLPGGNTVLYLDPAQVGFDPDNVTLTNIQVVSGTAAPAGKVPLARLVYNDAINSNVIYDATGYDNSGQALSLATALKNDVTGTYHVSMYDAGGIYWDRANSRLIVQRTRTDGDTRLALLNKNPVNSTAYEFKGTHGQVKAFTVSSGNSTLYINPAAVADPSNVTLDDIQIAGVPPANLTAGLIPLCWLIYGNTVNSRLIKDYSEMPVKVSGITNIIRYSAKKVVYNPADFSFTVAGTDLPQDSRVLIFDYEGVTYTMTGQAGSRVVKALDGGNGNQFLCIDRATLTGGNFTINDFYFSASATGGVATAIVLGRMVWNTAMNSAIVEIQEATAGVATVSTPRLGEAALFMAGKIPAEKQVLKLAIYGDSIFASGFKDLTFPDEFGLGRYEQPPRNGNLASVQRDIYNYLNFNKPTFRNIMHADWTTSGAGATESSYVMPNGNIGGVGDATQWERYLTMSDATVGNTAEITITGKETAVFVFEGGAVGTDWETGGVSISVSVNGGAFVGPSTVLQGKLTKRGFGAAKVYDAAQNTFQTSFSLPAGVSANAYNKGAPMKEIFYNGLNPANTYRFRISKAPTETRRVRLWGAYYFTGQTLVVHNESKPGFSWGMLASTVYGDLVVSETDFVILEAPMYHDGFRTSTDIEASAQAMIDQIRGYGIQLALCSCPPGGVIPAGRATTILGDPSGSAYHPGQNFNRYFDFMFKLNTSNLASSAESPKYGDIYSVTVGGTAYQFICTNSESPLPTSRTYWQAPMNFPGFSAMPATFTRVTGTGKASIVYDSYHFSLKFSEHRDVMERVAQKNGVAFCDIFQAFVDQAEAVGEDIYTEGYNMDPGHPLYATLQALDADNTNYPELSAPYKMNYLTNFVDIGDGHHLAYPAHPVIFEALKNTLLKLSAFK